MRKVTKIILVSCLPAIALAAAGFLLLTTLFAPQVLAQSQAPFNPYLAPNTNADVPQNLHTFTQNAMIEVMAAMTCQLAGIDPINPNQQCLGVDQQTGKIGFVKKGGGAIAITGKLIAATYTIPVHTGDYVQYMARNFGFVKPVQAQTSGGCNFGVGYCGISPLIPIWLVFRNIVYLLFVVIFTIIGLLIMFRIKIDPRTVMGIGNTIPQIIMGVILVTFSFAIAGFLIDLMYVIIYLISGIIAQADPKIALDIGQQITQSQHPLQAVDSIGGIGNIAKNTADSAGGFLSSIADNETGRLLTAVTLAVISRVGGAQIIGAMLSGVIIAVTGGIGTPLAIAFAAAISSGLVDSVITSLLSLVGFGFGPQILGVLGGFIVFIIILVALLWALFRLSFQLVTAYVSILIDIVLAPIWIVLGIFPGSTISFGSWLRDLLANLSAFPVTIAMFLLGKVFIDFFGNMPAGSDQFLPPMLGNPNTSNLVGSLIGLGIVLMTPQVVTIMKDVFKSPQIKYTSAIGQALETSTATGRQSMQAVAAYKYGTAPRLPGPGALWGKLFGV